LFSENGREGNDITQKCFTGEKYGEKEMTGTSPGGIKKTQKEKNPCCPGKEQKKTRWKGRF